MDQDLNELADDLERVFSDFLLTENTLCLEPIHPSSQALKLRASASEFVPQLDLQGDSQLAKESENDNSYDSLTDVSEYGNTSTSNRIKDGQTRHTKHNIHLYENQRHNQHSPFYSTNTEKSTSRPPPELSNGLPHFKGPYMPLLRHRMANAEAYGLIKGPNGFNNNNLLMQDLVQQLSQLDSFKDLNRLTIDLFNQSLSQTQSPTSSETNKEVLENLFVSKI